MKKSYYWVLAIAVALLGTIFRFMFNFFAGILAAALFALLVPLDEWQAYMQTFVNDRTRKVLIVVLTVLFCLCSVFGIVLFSAVTSDDTTATDTPTTTTTVTLRATTTTALLTTTTTAKTTTSLTSTTTATTATTATTTAATTAKTTTTTVATTITTTHPITTTRILTTTIITTTTQPIITTTESPVDENFTTYVLNTHTMKFHRTHCREVKKIKDENRQDFSGSRDDVISLNYIPCKICNP